MIVTVFRNRVKLEVMEEYGELGDRMFAIAERMPGFISSKDFIAEDGERLTIIEFETAETLRAWREHPQHVRAQQTGRRDFYTEYKLQVCELQRESKFPK